MTLPVGRPRSGDRQRPGGTPREEILDAAAELFTSRGYAATSTRMIAEAVGIRQASLYYHVASKEELLEELLAETVQPSLAFALSLDAAAGPVDARLFALAAFDTGVLCGGRWNLGALYLLPEVRGERFARFRAERAELRAGYAQLIRELTDDLAGSGEQSGEQFGSGEQSDEGEHFGEGQRLDHGRHFDEGLTDLVFGLVESVIQIRSEREISDVAQVADRVASGCLRLVGVPASRISDIQASWSSPATTV